MQPFISVSGVALAMLDDDMNTDQIAPLSMARQLEPDYADLLFKRQRVDADGKRIGEHKLNQLRYRQVSIFVGGRNFGCGSGREAAVWCLAAIGVRCVIARSLADMFRENCLQNGVLPIQLEAADADIVEQLVLAVDGRENFAVDLKTRRINGPGGLDIGFDISASDRTRLLEGLDEIGFTMKHVADIAAWEQRTAAAKPWLQSARDRRR